MSVQSQLGPQQGRFECLGVTGTAGGWNQLEDSSLTCLVPGLVIQSLGSADH